MKKTRGQQVIIEKARKDFRHGSIDNVASVVLKVIKAGRVDSERAQLLARATKILGKSEDKRPEPVPQP